VCTGTDARKSDAQQELIGIWELIKAKKISHARAEDMFREWQNKHHEQGKAPSFREKQVATAVTEDQVCHIIIMFCFITP